MTQPRLCGMLARMVRCITSQGLPGDSKAMSPGFVQAFVADKTRKMVQDVKELQLLTDPDIHFKLVKFCHNTRLAHLNRNLSPATMANTACGVQTVDQAVVNEVLAKGTGNRWRSWDQVKTNWHRMTVQLPPFKGGLSSWF